MRTDALLVPQRAVSELQGSFQVRVVGADNKVITRTVKVGDRVGSRWIIEHGLEPGARVVVEGAPTRDGTVVNPKPFTAPAAGRALSRVPILHRPSDRRHRHRDHHRAGRAGRDAGAADRAVSRHHPAADQRLGHLHRRRRADHRAVGRHAARAADERRRQHAVHAVDQRQRRHDAADRHLRRRDRSEHRSGQRPEPDGAGRAEPAARRQHLRPDDAQGDRLPDADRLAVVAEEHLRRAVPRQLREHQHHRRALPRARRRRRAPLRRRRLRDAHLGQAGSARQARADGARTGARRAAAEHGQSGGPDRRAAGADRAGDDLHGPRAGPAADGGGVRRDRRAIEPGRLGGAAEGRRPHRARRAQLPADRPRQRPAGLRGRRLSDAGLERAGRRRRRQEDDGGPQHAIPAGSAVPLLDRHDAAGLRRHPRDPHHARRRDRAGDLRRLPVPAELARDVHSDDRGAGVADRHLRGLPAARLLDQHAVAVRPRARHRPRRRRCDRRRRGGGASHRRGHGAARRHAEGDGGSVRAGGQHRADSRVGVHPGRLHERHSGPAEQAVRDHHRHLGDDLGVQRADACRRRWRRCCSSRGRRPTGCSAASSRVFNRWFDKATQRLRQRQPRLVRKAFVGVALLRGVSRSRPACSAGGCRPASCPRRTTATSC